MRYYFNIIYNFSKFVPQSNGNIEKFIEYAFSKNNKFTIFHSKYMLRFFTFKTFVFTTLQSDNNNIIQLYNLNLNDCVITIFLL